ncbi:MAG TPA: ornithine cyclodeaminase family protein [Nitrososphaerales archaeon]|nr:ornithine cyclodeaminase family protein [Nitrososphaerales archaeon]
MVLVLTSDDVESILTINDTISVLEKSFIELSRKQVNMTDRDVFVLEDKNGWFGIMTAHMKNMAALGTKLVTVFPKNIEINKPTTQAVISLIDVNTGELIGIIDGSLITGMRTGATTGIATKYLSKKNSSKLSILGSGFQSKFQLMAICSVRHIKEIFINSPSIDSKSDYIHELEDLLDIPIIIEKNITYLLNTDILVTSTTSPTPLFDGNLLDNGIHINCIGAHTKETREVDLRTIEKSKVVVDERSAALREAGELIIPIQNGEITDNIIYAELAEIVSGQKPGRLTDDEITLFKSMGLSLEDISTAKFVFDKAIEKGLGQNITLC